MQVEGDAGDPGKKPAAADIGEQADVNLRHGDLRALYEQTLAGAGHQPGDLIVFAPRWNDPVGRLHLGDLIPVEMAGRLDGERYGRIWELDIRGARAPETRGLTAAEVHDVGGVTVRRFERAGHYPHRECVPHFVPALVEFLDKHLKKN